MNKYDAAIIGSGPNGLAAAITLAQAGLSVVIIESKNRTGGGTRSSELTLPGFNHDICSTIHPLGAASPFFQNLHLNSYGLKWIYPPLSVVHPFDDGTPAFITHSVEETSLSLENDSEAYKNLMLPLVQNYDGLMKDILSPFSFPVHPLKLLSFGLDAVKSVSSFSNKYFSQTKSKALFAGLSAHSFLPTDKLFTAAFGLILAVTGHKPGWPLSSGGSQKIADALTSYFRLLGGEVLTNHTVRTLNDIPESKIKVFDLTPSQIIKIAGNILPSAYKSRLQKYHYGPGVFKIDYALNEAVPFKSEKCRNSATIHLGGSFEEISLSEQQVWKNKIPDNPFVIFVQPSLFDATRAPEGKHTAWAYCHVPNGSDVNMTERIENQIERFAPGFRDTILEKSTMNTKDLQAYNENYVGGDINGGLQNWKQLITRPVLSHSPYALPVRGFYICSASSPPGGGVHGMCGYNAAKKVLKDYHIHPSVRQVTY